MKRERVKRPAGGDSRYLRRGSFGRVQMATDHTKADGPASRGRHRDRKRSAAAAATFFTASQRGDLGTGGAMRVIRPVMAAADVLQLLDEKLAHSSFLLARRMRQSEFGDPSSYTPARSRSRERRLTKRSAPTLAINCRRREFLPISESITRRISPLEQTIDIGRPSRAVPRWRGARRSYDPHGSGLGRV